MRPGGSKRGDSQFTTNESEGRAMDTSDHQGYALTPRVQDPHGITPYDDALARLGEAAETYIRGNVFDDYHRKKSEGTKQAQYDDLATFSHFLSTAGISRKPEELFADPHTWQGMKA